MSRLLNELCCETLTEFLANAKHDTGLPGLTPIDSAIIGLMLVDVLAAVHRLSCSLHLDVKPENIFLTLQRKSDHPPFSLMHESWDFIHLSSLAFRFLTRPDTS